MSEFWRWLPPNLKIHWAMAPRPHYAYCLYHSAKLAKRLGLNRMAAIEFGVAGGNGLVRAEQHASWITKELGVEIQLFGFDSGAGLPAPEDYRDLPYHWRAGFFRMDPEALRARLGKSQLVLGDVRDTVQTFFGRHDAAPIGCIFHDLDFYSSTRDALKLFDGPSERFLPRVFNYFDDIIGSEIELYNDFTGQRRAIHEFNETHDLRKLARCFHLVRRRVRRVWHEKIFIYHDFGHPQYGQFVSDENQQLPLLTAE